MEQTNHGSSIEIHTTHQNASEHNFTDFISDLPDSLLLHNILSRLDTKEVIKTSLLSRRWRYLWKFIPCLYFGTEIFYPAYELHNFIDRCLFHHEGSKIHEFDVTFRYDDKYALLVDSWMYFAIRRKVENLKFESVSKHDIYRLPRSLYFCGTLTSLSLSRCSLNLPDSFQLGSLKELSLDNIELNPDSIERLSFCCPVLEDIHLCDCNKESDLNIIIRNPSVKRLQIERLSKWESGILKFYAPTLLSLAICGYCPSVSSVRFHIVEIGSLVSAAIDGTPVYLDCGRSVEFGRNWFGEILYALRHVKHLKLCGWCLLVLSLMKLQNVDLLSLSATCLELQTGLTKWELPGISYLLQSCSNLEKLKIVSGEIMLPYEFINKYDFEEEQYWESLESDKSSIMQKVKVIEIKEFCSTSNDEFVQFFLKKAKVLKSVVILRATIQEYRPHFGGEDL